LKLKPGVTVPSVFHYDFVPHAAERHVSSPGRNLVELFFTFPLISAEQRITHSFSMSSVTGWYSVVILSWSFSWPGGDWR